MGAQTVTYTYDALNRTQSRAVSGGSTTAYTYSGISQNPTSQTIGTGTPTYYAWGTSAPLAQQTGTTTRVYQQDPHGDLATIFDTSGNPTGTLSYDPWGNPTLVGSDATDSLLGYQSQPTDPITGLVDMGARLYDPTQARFTTQDTLTGSPTDPLTLNQYIYAGDSPLLYNDPTGNSYACPGGCDAATTVAYHAIQAIAEAERNHNSEEAAGYYAQAANWFAVAIATAAPPPSAPKPAAAAAVSKGANAESKSALAGTASEMLHALSSGAGAGAIGVALGSRGGGGGPSLDSAFYSPKVVDQLERGDYHGFPAIIDEIAESDGRVSTELGGDGELYTHIRLEGAIGAKEGEYHYIVRSDGTITHRLFEPNEEEEGQIAETEDEALAEAEAFSFDEE